MRRLLFISIIVFFNFVFSSSVFSQILVKKNHPDTVLNFILLNKNEIIWQKVYNTDNNEKKIIKYFMSNLSLKIESNDSTILTGWITGFNPRISPRGIRLYKNPLTFYTRIECKEGKYRVTLSQINSSKRGGTIIAGTGRGGGKDFMMEKYYIELGHFNYLIYKNVTKDFNTRLEELFTIKEEEHW